MNVRYFEDFREGDSLPLGPRAVTREEIVAFAAEFDPQPFHLDEEAAKSTPLGGLAASGWHTAALFMRMMCDSYLLRTASMGAPGVEELRWLRPVRPGDTLAGTATVLSVRASKNRPDMGIVQFRFELTNQRREPVMRVRNPMFFARKPSGAGDRA